MADNTANTMGWNDYLILRSESHACGIAVKGRVEALCRRNLGVGADGILRPFFDGDKWAFSTRME